SRQGLECSQATPPTSHARERPRPCKQISPCCRIANNRHEHERSTVLEDRKPDTSPTWSDLLEHKRHRGASDAARGEPSRRQPTLRFASEQIRVPLVPHC